MLPSRKPLQSRSDCDANFDLIRHWLSQCSQHKVCNRVPSYAAEFSLPARLIDVGSLGSTEFPRLVLSEDLDSNRDCRYVALSHCWGDADDVPKTLTNTLANHQKKISSLTKTFRDAIEVTQRIGIRYLWIDSLCIIQDEVDDFHRQCSRMHLVYSRSYLCISALDASNGGEGLFISRKPSDLEHCKPTTWESALNGPLSTRGWAFQEHQLSPRIIHFTSLRLLWECRVSVSLEDQPVQLYRSLVSIPRDVMLDRFHQLAAWRLLDGRHESYDFEAADFRIPSNRKDIYTRWLRCVEAYSGRAFTYDTDKLPAISGLAAAVASIIPNPNYLAGIWSEDLIRSLMWTPAVKDTAIKHATAKSLPFFPTWSWLSYDGSVKFLCLSSTDDIYRLTRKGHNYFYELWHLDSSYVSIKGETLKGGLNTFSRIQSDKLHVTAETRKHGLKDEDGIQIILDVDFLGQAHPSHAVFAILGRTGHFEQMGLILEELEPSLYKRKGVFFGDLMAKYSFKRETFTII